MFDKFRIKITILASLIITAYCFFTNTDFLRTGYIIIFTIIIFYLLGGIAELELKAYIEKIALLEMNELNDNADEETFSEDLNNIEEEDFYDNIETEEGDFYNDIEIEDEEESF